MIDLPEIPLPTLDRAGISSLPIISPADAQTIAQTWLNALSTACSSVDTQKVINDLLHPSTPFWRDLLALTWDFRTIYGPEKITALLDARLADAKLHDFVLNKDYTRLQQPFPDLAWVNIMFDFKTKVGTGTGIARLVPLLKPSLPADDSGSSWETIDWKAHTVFTNLDSLFDYPENVGSRRDSSLTHASWAADRETAADFFGAEEDERKGPTVLLIGAGQSGLAIAARLKALDVPALVVDKNERIGDNWRARYDSLCLHDPVWYDHMPYLPFLPTWPVYCPAKKLANWLEFYADALELNVWMSSTIASLTQDPQTNKWHITIIRRRAGEEQKRKLVVKHVIFCTGIGSPNPPIPIYPGMEVFKGDMMHSSKYKRALDHQGKKVVVVGACTSAHDIAVDCYQQGIDVTVLQRTSTYIISMKGIEQIMKGLYHEGGPPAEISDRLLASLPFHSGLEMQRRTTRFIAQLDSDIVGQLHKIGFRTNLGYKDTGLFPLVMDKLGGYYFDTGGSKLIADGKIKFKNDSKISRFTERSIVFENGTELEADVVVFSTGVGDTKDKVAAILSSTDDPAAANANAELIKKIKPIWGVTSEGEASGVWTYNAMGVPGLWYLLGNLAMSRFHSMHMALQIKAMEEGIWSGVYEG